MKDIVILLVHLLTTVEKFLGPGGAKMSVANCWLSSGYQRFTCLVNEGNLLHPSLI